MTTATRLCLALTISVLFHLALLAGRLPASAPRQPVRLDVKLAVPPAVPEEAPAADPALLEKNTIAQEEPPPALKPPPRSSQAHAPARLQAPAEQRALRKLSEHVLYPQAAVDAGLEGTVHLLLRLDTAGSILHASIAASSGHPELDHAAVQAALRSGRLNTGGLTEVILPITFRLQ